MPLIMFLLEPEITYDTCMTHVLERVRLPECMSYFFGNLFLYPMCPSCLLLPNLILMVFILPLMSLCYVVHFVCVPMCHCAIVLISTLYVTVLWCPFLFFMLLPYGVNFYPLSMCYGVRVFVCVCVCNSSTVSHPRP